MILFAMIGGFALQSCATQGGENGSTLNLDLSGNWTLTEISKNSGTNVKDGFPNKKPVLILEAISKKVTGNTGCNQLFGSFTTQNNQITFSGMGSTKMYCQDVKENEYLNMINQVHSYKIINGQLIFMDKDGKELLKYNKTKK